MRDDGNSVPAPALVRPDPGGYPARSGKVDVHLIGTASMAAAPGESPQGHGRGVGRRPRELEDFSSYTLGPRRRSKAMRD